jgi:hypothetical protein
MIELQPTKQEISIAITMSHEMGSLNNSITRGAGNVAGFLAEIVLARHLNAIQANTYDYDLILPDGRTVDVKTKRTTVAPQPHYECSVAAFNTRQKCDYYAFARVHSSLQKVWLLGTMEKQAYYDGAVKHKKGDIDPSNNFTFKADCYNMKISDLKVDLF